MALGVRKPLTKLQGVGAATQLDGMFCTCSGGSLPKPTMCDRPLSPSRYLRQGVCQHRLCGLLVSNLDCFCCWVMQGIRIIDGQELMAVQVPAESTTVYQARSRLNTRLGKVVIRNYM